MRKKIVAGNWKMNLDLTEGHDLVEELLAKIPNSKDGSEVILIPPFVHLTTIATILKDSHLKLGAQNTHEQRSGAYTGEVSSKMLKSVSVDYCLVGHSERRTYNNESDELLSEKLDALYEVKINPIYCIGEQLTDRENSEHFEVIKHQLQVLLNKTPDNFNKTIVAYEPVWAIGTGVTASAAEAQEMHAFIRGLIRTKFGEETAQNTTILYGGSCNAQNATELFGQKDVDGGLIGGASLKAEDFATIVSAL